MTARYFVELTACWGNDDADSTIKVSPEKWDKSNLENCFRKRKSHIMKCKVSMLPGLVAC